MKLMHGFGDEKEPRKDTTELVEAIAADYITSVVLAAKRNAGASSSIYIQVG